MLNITRHGNGKMKWINRSPYLPLVRCWVWATSFQPLELKPQNQRPTFIVAYTRYGILYLSFRMGTSAAYNDEQRRVPLAVDTGLEPAVRSSRIICFQDRLLTIRIIHHIFNLIIRFIFLIFDWAVTVIVIRSHRPIKLGSRPVDWTPTLPIISRVL